MEACNTQVFGGAGLPLTLQGGSVPGDVWQCTHTKYVPIFGGGKQGFGDNWDFFFLKIIKFSNNHLTVHIRKAGTDCGGLIQAEHKVSCDLPLPTFKKKFQEPIFAANLCITFKFPVGKLSFTYGGI